MSAEILSCSTDEYRADPCNTPSLSASIAHALLDQSPYHAWLMHPRLGGQSRRPTASMTGGTLTHALVLGEANGELVIVDAPDWRTKAAREEREAAVAAGKTAILRVEYLEAEVAASKLRQRIMDKGVVFDGGEAEVKVKWSEGPVPCRGMMDYVKGATIYDLKTIKSADLRTIEKHMREYGYDIQRAAYVSALEKLHPEYVGAVDFVFVFVETEAPYCVTPVRVDGMRAKLGEMKWERAVRTWNRCLRENRWPDYSDGIAVIGAKPWEIDEEMGRSAA